MNRLIWVTDIHLNFLSLSGVEAFCEQIVNANPDAVLVGGDIAEAESVESYLRLLAMRLQRPIYFVLGNHDFYGGSIWRVRKLATALTHESVWLHYLPESGIVELTKSSCLIGHEGWGDGRIGDYAGSRVLLNDYLLIRELTGLDKQTRLRQLNALGDEAAAYLQNLLPEALERFQHTLVLLHVPPFKESCWHQGRISDEDWLPHFTCQAVGDVLRDAMRQHPDRQMTVLCGHTHGAGEARILPNLYVKTGGAEYGSPVLQDGLTVQ